MPDGCLALSWLIGIVLEGVSVRLGQSLTNFVVAVDLSDEFVVIHICEVAAIHKLLQH
jgi:hypothetical protein